MKIFEVIFWSSHGGRDNEDTIYLVRAPDYLSAVEDVQRNASPSNHGGERMPLAHIVYEVGTDSSPHAETNPRILRGPYFTAAYNFGWRSWKRKMEGSRYTSEWEEDRPA